MVVARGTQSPLKAPFTYPLCFLALQQDPGEDGQSSVEPEHHTARHGEPHLHEPGLLASRSQEAWAPSLPSSRLPPRLPLLQKASTPTHLASLLSFHPCVRK